MSDPSPELTPPPPPPGTPPPAFQPPPGYAMPPGYQPPPPGYQPAPPGYQPAPGYAPTPYPPAWAPAAVAAGGTGALLSQFGGAAAWSIGCGIVAIVVPLVSTFYFPILPIVGLLNGWRAIARGRMIGGLVGIGLNIVAGILSLIASGLLFGGQ
jgi:hypothetical protein